MELGGNRTSKRLYVSLSVGWASFQNDSSAFQRDFVQRFRLRPIQPPGELTNCPFDRPSVRILDAGALRLIKVLSLY